MKAAPLKKKNQTKNKGTQHLKEKNWQKTKMKMKNSRRKKVQVVQKCSQMK